MGKSHVLQMDKNFILFDVFNVLQSLNFRSLNQLHVWGSQPANYRTSTNIIPAKEMTVTKTPKYTETICGLIQELV